MKWLLLLVPGLAFAQDVPVSWDISSISVVGEPQTRLELDVRPGNRYMAANGALIDNNQIKTPAVGTCFFTLDNGIFCTVQVDHFVITLDLASNANGTVFLRDSAGNILDTGNAFLSE